MAFLDFINNRQGQRSDGQSAADNIFLLADGKDAFIVEAAGYASSASAFCQVAPFDRSHQAQVELAEADIAVDAAYLFHEASIEGVSY